MATDFSRLAPRPQRLTPTSGTFTIDSATPIYLTSAAQPLLFTAQWLQQALQKRGANVEINAAPAPGPAIRLSIDPAQVGRGQGYKLIVDEGGIYIVGNDEAGAFYGVCTLCQLLTLTPGALTISAVQIVDWPDYPNRGIMFDITRDRVPTMQTLYELVDFLASLKINQLQLYNEHAFAYRGHEVVWKDASPMTGEEILALDAYCRQRFVELVPNQNSFGHMHRWLKHPQYVHLAEDPEGMEHSFSIHREPFSLAPLEPGSLELVADLFGQLLPHFSSRQLNVGLDETFDLGRGKSKEACEKLGKGRVYLDFLLKIYQLCKQHGVTMQFWSDIIVRDEPELVAELPHDVVALEWGYEADYPFDKHGELIAASGRTFYVCPGTSSWNTLAGRTQNAIGNIRNAAINGHKHGAIGLLTTDWGDNGHPQPLPVSYLGFVVSAAFSWNVQSAHDTPDEAIPALLDVHAFQDAAGVMGQLVYDLGNTYLQPEVHVGNSSILFWLLTFPQAIPERRQGKGELTEAALEQTGSYIDQVMANLDRAQMARPDAGLIRDEYRWLGDILRFSVKLGMARSAIGLDAPVSQIPEATRRALAKEMRPLLDRHAELWLQRSRPGGLEDGLARFKRTLDALEQ
jgi:hexosaminidase